MLFLFTKKLHAFEFLIVSSLKYNVVSRWQKTEDNVLTVKQEKRTETQL